MANLVQKAMREVMQYLVQEFSRRSGSSQDDRRIFSSGSNQYNNILIQVLFPCALGLQELTSRGYAVHWITLSGHAVGAHVGSLFQVCVTTPNAF